MEVFIDRSNTTKKVKFSGRVSDLLKKLKINPVTVIVTRENELLADEDDLNDKDMIKILSVISGG